MVRVGQVSRLLQAASRNSASWHAVSVVHGRAAHRCALRTLVREFPAALRCARSIGASVSDSRGFTSVSELCYYACAHVDLATLRPGTLLLGPLHFADVELRRRDDKGGWVHAGGRGDEWQRHVGRADDEWWRDAQCGEWMSVRTTATASGDEEKTRLPRDTLLWLQMRGGGCDLRTDNDLTCAYERDLVALRPNAMTRRLLVHNSDGLTRTNSHLLARAFPRLTDLSVHVDTPIDARLVPYFLRTVFDCLSQLERLKLSAAVNSYTTKDVAELTAADANSERRRRIVYVPLGLRSLTLDSRRARQPLYNDYERAGRASAAFLVLHRGASLERLRIDAALVALTTLADRDPQQSPSSSALELLPHLTELALTSGCLLDRSDLGLLLRLPTLQTVRLAAMPFYAPDDWRRDSGVPVVSLRATVRLAFFDCDVSGDFLRDVVALYPKLQTFQVDGGTTAAMDVDEATQILRESVAFRTGTLRHVHYADLSRFQFASPEYAPRTGVSCRCHKGGCRDCACTRAGVKCGHECHVSHPENDFNFRVSVASCNNAEWPPYKTGCEAQRTDVPKHSVWLIPVTGGSGYRVDTAVILPTADGGDGSDACDSMPVERCTDAHHHHHHLTLACDSHQVAPKRESWRVEALVYSRAIAGLVGRGSRCALSIGQYRDVFARHELLADGDACDEKRRCADPGCFCRSAPRVWKPTMASAPVPSSSSSPPSNSSSSTVSSMPSSNDRAPTDTRVRTRRGKRAWVHTVNGAGLLEATLAIAASTIAI